MTSQTSSTSNLIYHDQDENFPPPQQQHQQQYRHSVLRHQPTDRSVAQEAYYADEDLNDDVNLYDKETQPVLEAHPDPRPRQRQRGHTRAQYHPQPSQSQQQYQQQQQQQQRHQGQVRNRREQVLDDTDQENNGPLVQKEIEDARGIAYDNQYQSSRMELMERRGTKVSSHQQLSQTNQGQTMYQEHHDERDVTYQQQQQNQVQAQRPAAALARQQSMSQRPQQPPQPQAIIHRDDPAAHGRKRSGRAMEEGAANGRAAEETRHQAQAQQRVSVHATQRTEQQRRQQHSHKHQQQHADEERRKRLKHEQDHARKMEYVEMYRKLSERINYGDVYYDTVWEYRNVTLPKQMLQLIRNIYPSYMQSPENAYSLTLKLLKDQEWRNIGIRMSNYWENWMRHDPEPHVLLFRRPLGTGERLAREREEQEKEERRLLALAQAQTEAEKLKDGTSKDVEAPQEGVKQQLDQQHQQQLHLSPPPKQKYQDEQLQRPLAPPQKQRLLQQPLSPPPKQLQLQHLQQQQ
ncbi:Cyclin-dependent kinases regulatory subunit (Cell division control protein cks1) [Haplosporangium sp. Z 767]|nr:Cyclin-dependent kinases regulatory subunit (Cell division control protein cks1) [Haplosporangium sp. Z 767]KAF9196819.1 Cyclin-dependent kinases regulatory subunit (Cell division control protein cks1) [Haplosporangium sp. Z 11]